MVAKMEDWRTRHSSQVARANPKSQVDVNSWDDLIGAARAAGQERRNLQSKEMDLGHIAAMQGHETTARGHTLGHEVGMGEIGIRQQDLDLDKAAWDFTQNRYDRFGQHVDQMGLATSALATRGAMQDFGMKPSEDFWSPYEGMFEEQPIQFGPEISDRKRQKPNTARPQGLGSAAGGLGLETFKLPSDGPRTQTARQQLGRTRHNELMQSAPDPFEALLGTLFRR